MARDLTLRTARLARSWNQSSDSHGFPGREQQGTGGDDDMGCHTPGCTGEHATGTISHTVIHQKRSIVLRGVPASICPDCGDVVLSEETTIVIEDLLRRKARSKKADFAYGA
jgi:YgiT-type zinc finger domain-containing protein